MKKPLPLYLLLCASFIWLSCSKEKPLSADTPEELFESLSQANGLKQTLGCYTDETVKTVKGIMRQNGADESEMLPVLAFLSGAEDWDIISVDYSANDDEGIFDIVITRHRIDNMRGWRISCLLKKEDGRWKIDMADKLSASFNTNATKSGSSRDYLEQKLKTLRGQ